MLIQEATWSEDMRDIAIMFIKVGFLILFVYIFFDFKIHERFKCSCYKSCLTMKKEDRR